MRQVRLLESTCDLTVAGLGDKPDANIRYIEVAKPRASAVRKTIWAFRLLVGAFETYYWSQYHIASAALSLRDVRPDVIIANDLSALPLALRLADGKPVIYDAHEYAPREYEDQPLWRLLFGRYVHSVCRRYLPRAASMLTVCQGIAREYELHYGVKPLVVHNSPSYQHLSPSSVQDGAIRMVHHGVASRARHLEVMIDVMKHLDQRFTLDLMLVEVEPGYVAFLRRKARHDPRIRFVSPVPMEQLCKSINLYDVGLYLLPPDNFNHRHALPNKFFEFIQARLAVAIGPSPEMAALVRKYGCGIVAESFEPRALADMLADLDSVKIQSLKHASHGAAHTLCFEQDSQVIHAEIGRLTRWAE